MATPGYLPAKIYVMLHPWPLADGAMAEKVKLEGVADNHFQTPDGAYSIQRIVSEGKHVWRVADRWAGVTDDDEESDGDEDASEGWWMEESTLGEALELLAGHVNWEQGGGLRVYELPDGVDWPEGEEPDEGADEGEEGGNEQAEFAGPSPFGFRAAIAADGLLHAEDASGKWTLDPESGETDIELFVAPGDYRENALVSEIRARLNAGKQIGDYAKYLKEPRIRARVADLLPPEA